MAKYEPNELVLMHGPKFDGSGEIVERHIHGRDVNAYTVNHGYVVGPNPVKTIEVIVERVVEKKK